MEAPKTWEYATATLWNDAQTRFKGKLQIRAKREAMWLWWPLKWLLKIITFGKAPDMVEEYFAVLGHTVWTPGDGGVWKNMSNFSKYGLLSHELDHLDYAWFGDHDARTKDPSTLKKKSWLHYIWWGLGYGLWFYPFKFSTQRQKIEYYGYKRNMERYAATHHGVVSKEYREWIRDSFTAPAYFWPATDWQAERLALAMQLEVENDYHAGKLEHLEDITADA